MDTGEVCGTGYIYRLEGSEVDRLKERKQACMRQTFAFDACTDVILALGTGTSVYL